MFLKFLIITSLTFVRSTPQRDLSQHRLLRINTEFLKFSKIFYIDFYHCEGYSSANLVEDFKGSFKYFNDYLVGDSKSSVSVTRTEVVTNYVYAVQLFLRQLEYLFGTHCKFDMNDSIKKCEYSSSNSSTDTVVPNSDNALNSCLRLSESLAKSIDTLSSSSIELLNSTLHTSISSLNSSISLLTSTDKSQDELTSKVEFLTEIIIALLNKSDKVTVDLIGKVLHSKDDPSFLDMVNSLGPEIIDFIDNKSSKVLDKVPDASDGVSITEKVVDKISGNDENKRKTFKDIDINQIKKDLENEKKNRTKSSSSSQDNKLPPMLSTTCEPQFNVTVNVPSQNFTSTDITTLCTPLIESERSKCAYNESESDDHESNSISNKQKYRYIILKLSNGTSIKYLYEFQDPSIKQLYNILFQKGRRLIPVEYNDRMFSLRSKRSLSPVSSNHLFNIRKTIIDPPDNSKVPIPVPSILPHSRQLIPPPPTRGTIRPPTAVRKFITPRGDRAVIGFKNDEIFHIDNATYDISALQLKVDNGNVTVIFKNSGSSQSSYTVDYILNKLMLQSTSVSITNALLATSYYDNLTVPEKIVIIDRLKRNSINDNNFIHALFDIIFAVEPSKLFHDVTPDRMRAILISFSKSDQSRNSFLKDTIKNNIKPTNFEHFSDLYIHMKMIVDNDPVLKSRYNITVIS